MNIYYIVILAWATFYFFMSLRSGKNNILAALMQVTIFHLALDIDLLALQMFHGDHVTTGGIHQTASTPMKGMSSPAGIKQITGLMSSRKCVRCPA